MQFDDQTDIYGALKEAGIALASALQLSDQAKPAVWLQTGVVGDECEIAIGATKLGGCPDLPTGSMWPVRPAYPDAAMRAEGHYKIANSTNVELGGADSPEQCQLLRAQALQRAQNIENPFPLHFLAQINFSDIWAAGPVDEDLPRSGVLSIFYDAVEQPWGYDPQERMGYALRYHDVPVGQLTRLPMPQPLQDLPEDERLTALSCELHACWTPLPPESSDWDKLNLPQTTLDQLFENDWFYEAQGATSDGDAWTCHHVGGWPTPIQGDMQIEAALVSAGMFCGDGSAYQDAKLQAVRDTAPQWLLLAQFGTDEKGGLVWGDLGQVYVWIRRDDLQARRLDNAHLILQCS